MIEPPDGARPDGCDRRVQHHAHDAVLQQHVVLRAAGLRSADGAGAHQHRERWRRRLRAHVAETAARAGRDTRAVVTAHAPILAAATDGERGKDAQESEGGGTAIHAASLEPGPEKLNANTPTRRVRQATSWRLGVSAARRSALTALGGCGHGRRRRAARSAAGLGGRGRGRGGAGAAPVLAAAGAAPRGAGAALLAAAGAGGEVPLGPPPLGAPGGRPPPGARPRGDG